METRPSSHAGVTPVPVPSSNPPAAQRTRGYERQNSRASANPLTYALLMGLRMPTLVCRPPGTAPALRWSGGQPGERVWATAPRPRLRRIAAAARPGDPDATSVAPPRHAGITFSDTAPAPILALACPRTSSVGRKDQRRTATFSIARPHAPTHTATHPIFSIVRRAPPTGVILGLVPRTQLSPGVMLDWMSLALRLSRQNCARTRGAMDHRDPRKQVRGQASARMTLSFGRALGTSQTPLTPSSRSSGLPHPQVSSSGLSRGPNYRRA